MSKSSTSIWDNFDANKMTDEQRNHLLADMYGGYKQKQGKEIYVDRGAGKDGRARVPTGRYQTSTNYDFYKKHPGWSGVADEIDIASINSTLDLGQLADFVTHSRNNKQEEPLVPVSEVETEDSPQFHQLSQRAAEANASTKAYENVLLNRQGTTTIGNDKTSEQRYKDAYQDNLTQELRAKDPTALASAKAEYELADQQAAELADSFDLRLGSPSSNKNLRFS